MAAIHAQAVTYPSSHPSGKPLDGYLAMPPGDGPFPAVIVIHEIFGLNENIRDITRRFANAGYIALGVDLYSHGTLRPLCIAQVLFGSFLNPLDNTGLHDLSSAITYLQAQPGV